MSTELKPCPFCCSSTGVCDPSFPHPRTGATVKQSLTVPKAYAVFAENGNVICFSTQRQHGSLLALEAAGHRVVTLAEPESAAAGVPSSRWAADEKPDPHGTQYDCERAALVMGGLTDDELANGVFMHGNEPLNIEALMRGDKDYHPAIAWLTAAKDRIRWLSRKLTAAPAVNPGLTTEVRPGQLYTCTGKGGEYQLLGLAQGAGTLKGLNHMVYRNVDGVMFVREPEDFLVRMEKLPDAAPAPKQGEQKGDGWISAEDQLPQCRVTNKSYSSAEVLVWTESIGRCLGIYHHNGTWLIGSHGHRDVTHWQPLPNPPARRAKQGGEHGV